MKTDAQTRRQVLVTASELAEMLKSEQPPRIIAVQSVNPYTGQDSRSGVWIPGAVDAEAFTDFAAPAAPGRGSRPLPDLAALEKTVAGWGIMPGQTIVLYDNDRAMTAARGWWVLKWAGLQDVRVLDGGLPAWLRAGLPTSDRPITPSRVDLPLSKGHLAEITAENALDYARDGVLLDARIRTNYIGGPEVGGDPKRGHIPGALSAPTINLLKDEGDFAPSEILAAHFQDLGADGSKPVGVYCGAGMSAAHMVLALAAIGVEAGMYPGSWSEWIEDPSRPVKRGATP